MKPAPFEYYRPASTEEAMQNLRQLGYDGKVLAGGQSLIAAMNFRMARPQALVDLNNIPELFYVQPGSEGNVLIGTMTRNTTVEFDPFVLKHFPIINQAMKHIAHPQIRNRGTFGGNIAHADPAGQLPGVTLALNAHYRVRGKAGDRWVDADDFFLGPFMTVIQPDEMLVEIELPALPPHTGTSYQQVSRQRGSQAQVGVAAVVTLDTAGRCKSANLVMLCVGERALLARQAAGMLIGQLPSQELFRSASEVAATKEIDPGSDIHATEEYRRSVAGVLVRRALTEAFEQASRDGGRHE